MGIENSRIILYVRNNVGIRTQFFAAFLLIIICLLLVFSLISYRTMLNEFEKQISFSSEKLLELTHDNVESVVYSQYHAVNTIALNSMVQQVFLKPADVYNDNASQWFYDISVITDLNASVYSNYTINRFSYISDNGICNNSLGIGSSGQAHQFLSGISLSGIGWYREFISKNSVYMWLAPGVYGWPGGGQNSLTLLRKIQHPDNLRIYTGMVAAEISVAEFKDILNRARSSEVMSIFLLNENGVLITATDNLPIDYHEIPDILSRKNAPNGMAVSCSVNGKQMIAAFRIIQNCNWRVFMTVPYRQTVLVMAKNMFRNNLIILAVLVPIMMLFAFLAASFTAKPIKELTVHMHNQSRAIALSNEGKNEISVLIQSYNTMLDRVAETMMQQYELGQRIKTLELKSLRAQINPHFLYNTLELLHWMAFTAGEKEIDKLLMAMAEFYRLSLRSGEDMSTVGKELLHIEMYLTIQNARMDNSISLVVNIPGTLLSCALPTITLQPIVENSVLHGILEKEEESGIITIGAYTEEDDVILLVHDDGVGIPEEKLDTLLFYSSKSGYGIKNVHERIQIAFGQQYGLSYESVRGKGVTVKIRFRKQNPV